MKAKIILINWSLSFFGLGMEGVDGGMLWPIVGWCWFMVSTGVLIKADRKGVFKSIKE